MAGQTEQAEENYPRQYESEALLRDGSRISLKPVQEGDAGRWLSFLDRLNSDDKYLLFQHMPEKGRLEDAVRFCTVDYHNTFAYIAEVLREPDIDIVAFGKY